MKLYRITDYVTKRVITLVKARGTAEALTKYLESRIGPSINVRVQPIN